MWVFTWRCLQPLLSEKLQLLLYHMHGILIAARGAEDGSQAQHRLRHSWVAGAEREPFGLHGALHDSDCCF